MGIEIPTIEVRFQHLEVEGDVYVGSRALPTLLNVTLNTIEVFFFSEKVSVHTLIEFESIGLKFDIFIWFILISVF